MYRETPREVTGVPSVIKAGIQAAKPAIIDWILAAPDDANSIQVTLGSRWQELPVELIALALKEEGITISDIVQLPSRKRIQNHGIVLGSTFGELKRRLSSARARRTA